MQKKIDFSSHGDHIVQVVVERPDDRSPWRLTVRVRPRENGDWGAPWSDDGHAYFTCYDALAAGKAQAARMIEALGERDIAR